MKNLQLLNLESVDNVVSPELFEESTLDSPTESIFTDFKKVKAFIIDGDTLAEDALKLMRKAHVRMKIVVSNSGDFIGIISTTELSERHIVAEVAKGNSRKDILVEDLMIPRKDLHAFDYNELIHSKVKDVIYALESYKLRHCLVLDKEYHHIRGVISSSDISRRLQLPIDLNVDNTFSTIFQLLNL